MSFCIVAAAIVVFLAAYIFYRTGLYPAGNIFYCFEPIVLVYCGCVMLLLAAYLLLKKKVRPEILFSGLALGLGLAYLLVITPISPPDEQYHYSIAYKITNVIMNAENRDLVYSDVSALIPHGNSEAAYTRLMVEIGDRIQDNAPFAVNTAKASYWMGYLPQAIGVLCGRLLNRNFITIFVLGRFVNLLFYAWCVYNAVKHIPRYKALLGTIAIMPMALHQAASFSTDSFINGMSFIIIAYAFKMIWATEVISRRDMVAAIVAVVLLAPAKVVYCSLMLLFFLIPGENFGDRNGKVKMLSVMLLSAIAFALMVQFHSILDITHTPSSSLNWEGQENYNLSFVFSHPLQTMKIFWDSLVYYGETWLWQIMGSSLSGLTLFVNRAVIKAYAVVVLLCAYEARSNTHRIDMKIRASCWIVAACVVLLTMASMFLGWTSNTRTMIAGVQGRYFIPVFPLMILPLSVRKIRFPDKLMNVPVIAAAALNVLVIADVLRQTLQSVVF